MLRLGRHGGWCYQPQCETRHSLNNPPSVVTSSLRIRNTGIWCTTPDSYSEWSDGHLRRATPRSQDLLARLSLTGAALNWARARLQQPRETSGEVSPRVCTGTRQQAARRATRIRQHRFRNFEGVADITICNPFSFHFWATGWLYRATGLCHSPSGNRTNT